MMKAKFGLLFFLSITIISCGTRQRDDSAKYCPDGTCYIEAVKTSGSNPCQGFIVPLECLNQSPGTTPGGSSGGSTGPEPSIPDNPGITDGCVGECGEAGSGNGSPSTPTSDNGEPTEAVVGKFFNSLSKETSKTWGKIRDEINGKNAKRRKKAREAKRLLAEAKDLWAQAEIYGRSINASREELAANLASIQNSVAAADGVNLNQSLKEFRDAYNSGTRSALGNVPELSPSAFAAGTDRHDASIYVEQGKIDQARRYLDYASEKVETFRSNRDYLARKSLLAVSKNAIDESEASFKAGNPRAGSQLYEFGMVAADIAISVTPVIGWGKDIYEAVSGVSLLDSRRLSSFERTMAIVGVLTAGVGSKLTLAGKAGKIGKVLSKGAKSADEASAVIKSADKAEAILDASSTIGWNAADIKRLANNARDVVRHGPMNPGRMHEIPMGSGTLADTFRSGSYFTYQSTQPVSLYRVTGRPHRQGDRIGRFWTRDKPSGPVQAIIDSALDPTWGNLGTYWTKVEVPAGTIVHEGVAASQRGLVGGGNQIVIEGVFPSWITEQGKF